MSSWAALRGELDRWADEGRTATFWWRDDDATRPTCSLYRLLDLRSSLDVPLSVAVIPAQLEPGLACELESVDQVHVMQHGYAHRNHAPHGQKKAELGPHRSLELMREEIRRGWRHLSRAVPRSAVPVLVPPWNRIDPRLICGLPSLGLQGLSTYGARRRRDPRANVRQANCHLDSIDWRATRCFKGEALSLDGALGHLRARRARTVDADEPTGLLSHHLDLDEPGWAFLARFIETTRSHTGVRWLDGRRAVLGP